MPVPCGRPVDVRVVCPRAVRVVPNGPQQQAPPTPPAPLVRAASLVAVGEAMIDENDRATRSANYSVTLPAVFSRKDTSGTRETGQLNGQDPISGEDPPRPTAGCTG